ncbi:hypothetical protein GCM10027347_61240 [Larkinella harenae]
MHALNLSSKAHEAFIQLNQQDIYAAQLEGAVLAISSFILYYDDFERHLVRIERLLESCGLKATSLERYGPMVSLIIVERI